MSPWAYDNIKELDGFFDYRYLGKRNILVLESKLERLNINPERLVENLFEPLKELFPKSSFPSRILTHTQKEEPTKISEGNKLTREFAI